MRSLSAITVDILLNDADVRTALECDARRGLTSEPKSIPPTWFYDEEGSRLFEEITRLPEYYPTRAERALLEHHAPDIASAAHADTLVEIGAGACGKTRLLLDAMADVARLTRYVPFDVSAAFLEDAASALAEEYEGLEVHAVVGDFHRHLDRIPATGDRLVAFLGGTIGNLLPAQRQRFFRALHATMAKSDHLLLGTDLVKDRGRIIAAYDDAAGVTAAFNRNVLCVMNRSLDADFAPDRFAHVAHWEEHEQWIEMRLRSDAAQTVHIRALDMKVDFEPGEDLLTEISAKFTPGGVAAELRDAGFTTEQQWGAASGDFLLTLARPRPARN